MRIENLSKNYTGFHLSCPELCIDEGLFLLKGENGSGKTTFLKLLCRLDKKYTGLISQEYISWYFQNKVINYHLSFNENIKLINDIDKKRCNSLISRLHCENLLDNKMSSLSVGEKQRLEIITCLSRQADVFLLDEPYSGLDKKLVKILSNFLKNLSSDHLIIVSDHGRRKYKYALSIKDGIVTSNVEQHNRENINKCPIDKAKLVFFKYLFFNKFNLFSCFLNLIFSFLLIFTSFGFSSAIFGKIKSPNNDYFYVYERQFNHNKELYEFVDKENIKYAYYENKIIISANDYKDEWKNTYKTLNFESISENILSNISHKLSPFMKRIKKELFYSALFSLCATCFYVLLMFIINCEKHKIFHDLHKHYYVYLGISYFFILLSSVGIGCFINVLLKKLLLK